MNQRHVWHRLIIAAIFITVTLIGLLYVSMAIASADNPTRRLAFTSSDYPIPGNVLSLHLDEVSGATTFDDSSGWGNDGTCTGDMCPQSGIPGIRGSALHFDGEDDFVQGSINGFPTGNDDRTMAAWVRMDEVVAQNAFFVGYGGFDYYSQIYLLYAANRMLCFSQSGESLCGPNLELDRWYHVAVTNVGNYATIYLDGVPQSSGYLNINTAGNNLLYLGTVPGTYGNYHRLYGSLDEVLLFNRALSTQEILAIYQSGAGQIFTQKTVDKPLVHQRDLVNYTIEARNTYTDDLSTVLITDTLPINLAYVDGSLSATSGTANYQDGTIHWTGMITTSSAVTVSFAATVSPIAPIGSSITNEALINAEGEIYTRQATIDVISHRSFMPCVYKPCPPVYEEDFSNPSSGWDVYEDDDLKIGYIDGEYQILLRGDGYFLGVYNNFEVYDYRLEVDARPASHLDGTVGLIFGLTDGGFYTFEISDGWYSVWRNDSGSWTWTPLINWTYSTVIKPGHQGNHLEVTHIGNSIQVSVNGQVLGMVYDSTYKGRGLGMTSQAFTANFDGRFDNLKVYTGTCIGLPLAEVPPYVSMSALGSDMMRGPGKPPR